MAGDFLDTNVLIYLLEQHPAKAERAERLVAAGAVVSVQVLSEIVATARRKRPKRWADTVDFLEAMRPLLTIVPLTLDMHVMAVALIGRYGLSPYDATIVSAALLAECTTLWSEDMQDGLVIERQLTVRNPFSAA